MSFSALQLPKTSSLFTNEIAEKRRIAAEEKRREVVLKLAKSEQMKCEQMSLVLNNSPEVQSKRKRFALFVLLRQVRLASAWLRYSSSLALILQAFYFILVMTVFAVTTPTAVDFGSSTMARYRSIVNSRLQETYDVSVNFAHIRCVHSCALKSCVQIRTREDWWVWFDKHILWVDVGAGEDQSRRLNPDREAWAVNDPVYPYRM